MVKVGSTFIIIDDGSLRFIALFILLIIQWWRRETNQMGKSPMGVGGYR